MPASDRARRGLLAVAALALILGGIVSPAHAEAPNREQSQLRQLRLQLRQLQQDNEAAQDQARKASALQKQAELAKAELESRAARTNAAYAQVRAELADRNRQVSELDARVAAGQRDGDEKAARITELDGRLALNSKDLDETRRQLGQNRAALAELERRHHELDLRLEAAIRNNLALYAIGVELLDRYRNKGVAEALAAQEPFLQLERVQLENAVQDYRERLAKERLAPATPK